jgi:hypothetical protein
MPTDYHARSEPKNFFKNYFISGNMPPVFAPFPNVNTKEKEKGNDR